MKTKQPTTYKVLLSFFEDDANGEFGLAHANSIKQGFNAFWNGIGIFHDIFEHYFEDIHPYFKDKYAFNIGGEICAMGHLAYYWETFRPQSRKGKSGGFYNMSHSIAHSTIDSMIEAIKYGYSNFGSRLECAIPKQKSLNSYMLNDIISEHQYCMETCTIEADTSDLENARIFKRSITNSKIERLYTYGYLLAEQIAPYSEHNGTTLNDFITYWDTFCVNHSAEELTREFEHLEFEITTGEKLSWTATFIAHDGTRVDCKEVKELLYA